MGESALALGTERSAGQSPPWGASSYNRFAAKPARQTSTHAVVSERCLKSLDRHELYADFQPLVKRLIRQYGDCHELRQDLAGEIYCRFNSLLDAYDPERGVPLKPYLVRQLTASVYTYARHQWRRQRREVSIELNIQAAEAIDCPDPTRQWLHDLAMQQVIQALPDGIQKLPQRQKQVLIWRYYEGRSFEEISELLNIRLATARSILRHSLNNLRRWMAQQKLEL